MYRIYGTKDCSFCYSARDFLKLQNIEYEYIDVTQCEQARKLFKERNFRTVPQVFSDTGNHIGGYQDLIEGFK